MAIVWLVALVALLQYTFFIFMVGRARGRFGVSAPAVTGHEGFECYYRVQLNTVELLVGLLPSMGIAAMVVAPWFAALMGAIYVVGRQLYFHAYTTNPKSRGLGFVLSMLPILILIITSLVMIIRSLLI